MTRIAITGAAGDVGTAVRPALRALGYELMLTDRRPVSELRDGERAAIVDVLDTAALEAAFGNCDAVLHLAACTDPHAGWPEQVSLSVTGANNVFEAARKSSIRRIVLASTHHVVGLHPRNAPIDNRAILRPDSRYGVGKAYGEALGAFFAYKYDMRVLAIRIGNLHTQPIDRRRLGSWLSARDLAQLVDIGIRSQEFVFEVVYGNSDGSDRNYDNSAAYRLGYRPQDSSDGHEARILAVDPVPAPGSLQSCLPSEQTIGGAFSDHEFVGDTARLYDLQKRHR